MKSVSQILTKYISIVNHYICRTYVEEIEKIGVCGKISLAGYSFGTVIAWAMASILPADIEVMIILI